MKSQEWNDYLFILPLFFLQFETMQYIIGFIVELFLDLSCVNACLIAFLTAVLACIQIIGMHWGYIFLLCTSSPPQAYVWYKIHSITLHCVYMLFQINTKCQNKKCILWATIQWLISFFLLIPTALSTAHSVFPLYCARLLNIDSLGVSGWTFSDVLLSATLLLNVIFCVVRHHTIRHVDFPFLTRCDTSLSAPRAVASLLRAVLRFARLHTITHVNHHFWLQCDTSRSVPRAAASLLRAVLRFARHHTVRRVNRHTWTRCVTSISVDVTSDRQSCARSHVACMQCDHNRESPPSAVWHSPTYHQSTLHAATHVVTLLSLPPTNITR